MSLGRKLTHDNLLWVIAACVSNDQKDEKQKKSTLVNDGGMCFGLAAVALQALFAHDIETFDKRIQFLADTCQKIHAEVDEIRPSVVDKTKRKDLFIKKFQELLVAAEKKRFALLDEYKKTFLAEIKQTTYAHLISEEINDLKFYRMLDELKQIKNDQVQEYIKQYHDKRMKVNQSPELSPSEQILLDVSIFSQEIVMHFFPEEFPHFIVGTDEEKQSLSQDVRLTFEKSKKPAKVYLFFGAYDEVSLIELFDTLKSSGIFSPLILESSRHTITANFEKDQWILIDANHLPTKRFTTTKELASQIFTSFPSRDSSPAPDPSTKKPEIAIFRTTILCAQTDEQKYKEWLEKDSEINKKNLNKLSFSTEGKLSHIERGDLLYLASQNKATSVVDALLQAKANPDQPRATKNKATPLFLAVLNQSDTIVTALLNAKADPNQHCSTNNTIPLLLFAAQNGQVAIVTALLDAKALPTQPCLTDNTTPLFFSAKNGHLEVVKILLTAKALPNQARTDGVTPLSMAFYKGHIEVVNAILKNLVETKNDGSTPLHIAAEQGHTELARYLIDKKANLEAKTNDGSTPLHMATQQGHTELVRHLLIDQKANLEAKTNDGSTPLHIATQQGHTELVRHLLIEQKANLEVRKNDGATILHVAAENNRVNTIRSLTQLLVEQKSMLMNAEQKNKETPLHIASRNGNPDVVKALLDFKEVIKPSLSARNNMNETPLAVAVKKNDAPIAKILIDAKTNPQCSITTTNGITIERMPALYWAAANNSLPIVSALLDAKATADTTNTINNETPLFTALRNFSLNKGDKNIIKALLKAKADPNANPAQPEQDEKESPLMFACTKGDAEIIKSLLEHKAQAKVVGGLDLSKEIGTKFPGDKDIQKLLKNQRPELLNRLIGK